MQNYRKTETPEKVVFVTKLETVPGGGTVAVKDLGDSRVYAGSPLRKANTGLYHVIKIAKVVEAVSKTGTTVKVAKGSHFKAGDTIGVAGTANTTVAAIDRAGSTSYDTITLTATLGALAVGAVIEQIANATSHSGYVPYGFVGETFDVEANGNHLQSIVVRGTIDEACLACPMSAAMKEASPYFRFV